LGGVTARGSARITSYDRPTTLTFRSKPDFSGFHSLDICHDYPVLPTMKLLLIEVAASLY
jgi:hypothetical protein